MKFIIMLLLLTGCNKIIVERPFTKEDCAIMCDGLPIAMFTPGNTIIKYENGATQVCKGGYCTSNFKDSCTCGYGIQNK